MFKLMGDVLLQNLPDQTAPTRRAPTPVRRHSRAAGFCEGMFWRRTDRQETRKIVLAARRFELVNRAPGSRNGPLGSVAIEVLELLANLVNHRTGRLDPSLDTLMRMLKRSRDAIVRALKALRAHGFLDWLRRYVPTGKEGRGPQVQQTSNAYRMLLPACALRLLGRMGLPVPTPDDVSHAAATREAELDAYRASLPLNERALFVCGDTPLGRTLASLGSVIMERESASRSESPSGDK